MFWLSDEQWKRIEPVLPMDVRGVRAGGRPPRHRRHRAGGEKRIAPRPMVRRRRSITASCAGRGAGSGKICSGNLPETGRSANPQMINSTSRLSFFRRHKRPTSAPVKAFARYDQGSPLHPERPGDGGARTGAGHWVRKLCAGVLFQSNCHRILWQHAPRAGCRHL